MEPDLQSAQKLASAYTTRLAFNLIEALEQPYTRVVEDVQIDYGECRRRMTIDWRLPTLSEALPDDDLANDVRFQAKFAELAPELVVPLMSVPRGSLMHDFAVEAPGCEQLYVCGYKESVEQTCTVLLSFWGYIENSAATSNCYGANLVDRARQAFLGLPAQKSKAAWKAAGSVREDLDNSGVALLPGLADRVSLLSQYVARFHVMWVHVPYRPGQRIRLTLTYRTRFAADYSPRVRGKDGQVKHHRYYRRTVDCVRRIVGQEPYRFSVPVSMSSYSKSYHFTMPAPPGMYFTTQRFVLRKHLYEPSEKQRQAFKKYYRINGAHVAGKDEAGGPVAHLYARDLPPTAENQLYAYARLRERPPGSTAVVMSLASLTAAFLWMYFSIWKWLITNDTKGIDLAALSVALLVVASIWFSRAFRDDIRSRVPVWSRLGLTAVAASMIYSLGAIFVHRVTCPATPEPTDVQGCPSPVVTHMFSQQGLLGFAILVTAVTIWLAVRRVRFHREYQALQANAIERYMS